MAYIDTIIASKPRIYNLYNDSPNGEIPLIDTQFGNFDFLLAYEETITDLFRAGMEGNPFSIELWAIGTVRVGHSTGGMTIYPKRVALDFAAGSYEVKLLEDTAMYVVLTYSTNSLRLYVNNVMVFETDPSEVEFVDESILGVYQGSPDARYDGFALYDRIISPQEIEEHWNAGTNIDAFINEQRYTSMQWLPTDSYVQNTLFEFDTQEQWLQGLVNNVVVTDTIDSMVENEVAAYGDWTCDIPLSLFDVIHDIKIEFSATDNVVMAYTLDGVTTPITGTTIITTPGTDLEITVSFPENEVCKVDWLRVVVYTSDQVFAFQEMATTFDQVVWPSKLWEPNGFNARAGAKINGSIEFGESEEEIKELYAFLKPTSSGAVFLSADVDVDDTMAVVGPADIVASEPVNDWVYMKLTFDTPMTGPFSFENCTLLSLSISAVENPTLDVNKLFADTRLTFAELELVAVTDEAVRAYSNKWSVTGAGG